MREVDVIIVEAVEYVIMMMGVENSLCSGHNMSERNFC